MKIKKTLISAILIFLGFNLLFSYQSWVELFSQKNSYNTAGGDSPLAEFILENNYQLIKSGNNPFILKNKLFYPFEINVSLNDPGLSNVIFFFIFRPFLDIHKSMLLVVLINIFLANFFMFLLLKKFNIHNTINIILSLSFGFLPIITYISFGHYTYTSIYIFPLVFITILNILFKKNPKDNIKYSFFVAFIMAFILLLNFYYFLAIIIGIFLYLIYFLIKKPKKTLLFFQKNVKQILISALSFLALISPWIYSVFKLFESKQIEKSVGFGGAQELSGDLFGFFTPSEFNPIYNYIFSKLSVINIFFKNYFNFYSSNTVKFIYPGIIILITYISLFFYKNNIPLQLWKKIKPHLIISLVFASILLGPFLKIFNRWVINLDGVGVLIPMPFLLLHYIPGLSSLRAPTRLTPVFVFLALIVTGYIIDYFFRKINKKHRGIFIICLFLIFFVDQFALLPKREYSYSPLKIYKYLEKTDIKGTVFEIPFTVRDGFQYMGFVHAIGPMNGHLIHKKPIIGGYFARVPQKIFDFYKNKKFIDYVASIIDKGNYDPDKEKPKEPNIYSFPYSITTIEEDLISLNVKFIILKNDEKYSSTISNLITQVGFKKTKSDNNYDLYIKI